MMSFSFSSGSAVLADFTVNNKESGSLILVHSLSGQGQFTSQSRKASGDHLRICFLFFVIQQVA